MAGPEYNGKNAIHILFLISLVWQLLMSNLKSKKFWDYYRSILGNCMGQRGVVCQWKADQREADVKDEISVLKWMVVIADIN